MENKKRNRSAEIIHEGKVYLLEDLPKENLRLTPTEEKILKARLAKPALIQVATPELQDKFDDVLRRISVLTGMILPANDWLGAILKAELITFLLDFGYKLLNEEEVILAFQLNSFGSSVLVDGTTLANIEPRGEFLNIMFCAKVLSSYMILRNTLDLRAENILRGY